MDPLLGKPPEQIPSEFWKVICSNVIELRGPLFYLGTLYISSYRMVFVAYNKKNIAMVIFLVQSDLKFSLVIELCFRIQIFPPSMTFLLV